MNRFITVLNQSNVFYYSSQNYDFKSTCEYQYIKKIIGCLIDEFDGKFAEISFYIYSEHKGDCNFLRNIGRSGIFDNKKSILIYLSDETGSIPDKINEYFLAVFKAYLPIDKIKNIYSLPVGYSAFFGVSKQSIFKRSQNVFFSGNLNSSRIEMMKGLLGCSFLPSALFMLIRKLLPRLLDSKMDNLFESSYIRFTDGFRKGLSEKKYVEYLKDSKVCLCPRGFINSETFRHFEAMRAGCVLVSESLPDVYYYKKSPILIVKNWVEGKRVIDRLLSSSKRLERIQRKTINWYKNICSEKAVAKYMYQIISSQMLEL